jgi:hypothetical protein
VVVDDGTPVAPDTAPGAGGTGLGTSTLVLEMGALYVEGNEPPLTGTLIKVQVDNSCNVCVEGEPIRGNIVFTDGTAVEANDCGFILVGCIVPDVLDMDETEAGDAIVGAGLVVGDTTYQCDDVEAAGEVLSQEPAGSTIVDCGTDVNLVVSTGTAVVPNVVGINWETAVAAIEANDLVANPSPDWNDTIAKDLVISQDPAGGSTPGCGSTVDILVSRGPQPDNPMPTDPNYSGQYNDCDTYISYGWDPSGGSGGWFKPYHCMGDADGATEGTLTKYRVSAKDVDYITANWKKKFGWWPWVGANPAADVDHRPEGTLTKYRVSARDVDRITCYWKKKDSDLNANPRGLCPWKDVDNNAWTCP